MRHLVLALVVSFGLAACDNGGLPGVAIDAGAIDAEAVAVDSQPAVVIVDAEPCITTVACADGFHRATLSEHYDSLGIYACAVNTGGNGAEVANPCGAGEIYGYRSADLVTCLCH